MEERTTGIILRTRLLTETSLIVHWLTADAGRIATVAKGARRPRSAFRGKLDLFHQAALSFRRSRRSELHTLSEVVLETTFPGIRAHWQRLNQAAYAVALIEQSTETGSPIPATFALFREFLDHISTAPFSQRGVLALELRHLAELGLLPDLGGPNLSPAGRDLAADLLQRPWNEIPGLANPPEALRALSQFLHGFIIHHLDRLPRGRAAALSDPPHPLE